MSTPRAFNHTHPDLLTLLEDLRRREPIFHRPGFPTRMSPDYWEVGASGRRYSRDFILRHLEQNPPIDASVAGWQISDHALQQLGPDTYLLTYTLDQCGRLTRRSTVWKQTGTQWIALFHQGTLITLDQDNVVP